jgi:hypothetical protein
MLLQMERKDRFAMMKPLFVDEIENEGKIKRGYVVDNFLVEANLDTIYSSQEVKYFFDTVEASPLGKASFLGRYCQFILIVNLKLRPEINHSMVIIDCHSDADAALDEYLYFSSIDWDLRDKFMQFFTDIQIAEDLIEAEMIVSNS